MRCYGNPGKPLLAATPNSSSPARPGTLTAFARNAVTHRIQGWFQVLSLSHELLQYIAYTQVASLPTEQQLALAVSMGSCIPAKRKTLRSRVSQLLNVSNFLFSAGDKTCTALANKGSYPTAPANELNYLRVY
eukprot:scpid105919/ scgid14883/ 